MAKKEYDVSKGFLEVAERARQQTEQSKKKKPQPAVNDQTTFTSRPGAGMNIARDKFGKKKDVNLPIKTGPR
jgi:hypothetical protein